MYSEHLIEKKVIDPYYIQFIVDTDDEEIIDRILDETVEMFSSKGFKTAILTTLHSDEPNQKLYMVKCAAMKITMKGETKVLSKLAEIEVSDQVGFKDDIREADTEPKLVSFNFGVRKKPG